MKNRYLRGKPARTDGEIVKLAREWHALMLQIWDLRQAVAESEHPNAEPIAAALDEQCTFYAWPEHVIVHLLEHPDQWETGNWGIRHKAATQAKWARDYRNR